MKKLFLASLLALAPLTLATADLKIAVIDLGKAFDGYYKTKDANTRLQAKGAAAEKDFRGKVTTYQQTLQEVDALDKASKDPTLSPAARDDKAKALEDKKKDLVSQGNTLQEMKVELTREMEEEKFRQHKALVDEINKVINDYAGPQGFDIVIDKSSQSVTSGVPIVLYNSSKLTDITADIIDKLNKSAPAPGGAAPSGGAAPAGKP